MSVCRARDAARIIAGGELDVDAVHVGRYVVAVVEALGGGDVAGGRVMGLTLEKGIDS